MKIAQVGEDILRKVAEPVEQFELNQKPLNIFIDELLTTMLESDGIGIAASQVFDPRAIMIIASRPNPRYPAAPQMAPLVLINPKITAQSEHTVWEWEGCLSVPGLRGNIERADSVTVSYVNQHGEPQQSVFEGFVARIFLHEFDHLIGKTWLDHISDTKNIMASDVWMRQFSS